MFNVTCYNWEPRQPTIPYNRVETQQALQREGFTNAEAQHVLDDVLAVHPRKSSWKQALEISGRMLVALGNRLQVYTEPREAQSL